LDKKIEFYIAFYEQLALQGFQAYKPSYDYENKHIADICFKGYNIAHLTKSGTIEPNPNAEIPLGALEQIRYIAKETAELCGITNAEPQQFTEKELSMIHANLVRVRLTMDDKLSSQETAEFDALIEKIEGIVPELADLDILDFENLETVTELDEGVEQ